MHYLLNLQINPICIVVVIMIFIYYCYSLVQDKLYVFYYMYPNKKE